MPKVRPQLRLPDAKAHPSSLTFCPPRLEWLAGGCHGHSCGSGSRGLTPRRSTGPGARTCDPGLGGTLASPVSALDLSAALSGSEQALLGLSVLLCRMESSGALPLALLKGLDVL